MATLTFAEVRAQLDALEAELNSGATVDVARLNALEATAVRLAAQSKECHPIPRLARLMMRVRENAAAQRLLRNALTLSPDNVQLALLLANVSADLGDQLGAIEVLLPWTVGDTPNAAILGRVADLNWKIGRIDESLDLHRKAAAIEKGRHKWLLNSLIMAQRAEEALHEARSAIAERPTDPALGFACFNAIARYSTNKTEISQARSFLVQSLPDDATGALWRARLCKWEQNYEGAIAELDVALTLDPKDAALLRERASAALLLGHWGRDARALHEARAAAQDSPDLRERIEQADALLQAFGGSLAQATDDSSGFAHVRSPESVFELVSRQAATADRSGRGMGLVMIAHSLTAGGAERMIAVTFRHLRADPRFDWVKLYVFNLSAENGSDFYLPLTGLDPAEAVLLDRHCRLEQPFSMLPPEPGRTAQAIYNRLIADRPAIVHASLEPLTIYAGLAALKAQIPSIVLHTHNMRPTALHPESPSPPRWRDCYATLLARAEVRLVGCAQASIDDYADWIGLERSDRLAVVYNGLNFDLFQPAADPESPARLRASMGIERDAPVIGTAFKFREEKRPLLWAEAACLVLEKRRDARFVMFGDGSLLAATKDYVASRGAMDQFVFPGLVSDIHRWLPMLDLFVLSSMSEALPNVLLEAQAAGVPVIAHHVGGIGETMIDGTTGLLVKEDGAEALAAAVLKAIGDPTWHRAASRAATAFVRERFSTESMIRNLGTVMLEPWGPEPK